MPVQILLWFGEVTYLHGVVEQVSKVSHILSSKWGKRLLGKGSNLLKPGNCLLPYNPP